MKAHTKSLELPAELVPEAWPSMALGLIEIVADRRKKRSGRRKERREAKLRKEVGEARSRQAQTDDPAAPLSFAFSSFRAEQKKKYFFRNLRWNDHNYCQSVRSSQSVIV
jgi:hypothetical protein